MRTIANIPQTPFQQDSDFPDGAILNETIVQVGTAVVREIYNDVLINLYYFMRQVGIEPNGIEDSASNGYQLYEALQKLTNILGDVEQQITLIGSVYNIGVDITNLPNKYIFIVRASGAYVTGNTYTFKGTESSPTYSFTSPTGFKDGDEVLVILDESGVRAYGLISSAVGASTTDIFVPFGSPVAYNNTAKVWYQEQGVLFSDLPESYDLQSVLRTSLSSATIVIYEMMVIGGYVLCLTFDSSNNHYNFYKFAISNLAAAPVLMTMTGPAFPTGTVANDYQPFVYTDGTSIYLTNSAGSSANAYAINKYTLNLTANTITGVSSVSLDSSFVKTTNAVISGIYLYTFISGTLLQYNLSSGAYKYGASFPTYLGVIFVFNGNIYYSNGNTAKKWTIPVYS